MKRVLIIASDDTSKKVFHGADDSAIPGPSGVSSSQATTPLTKPVKPVKKYDKSARDVLLQCPECGQVMKRRTLYRHLFDSHGYNKDALKLTKMEFLAEKRQKRMKENTCSKCSRTFRCKKNLETHLSVCTAKKPITCHFCSATFHSQEGFVHHCKDHVEISDRCEVDTLEFQYEEEFFDWKEAVEQSSTTSFIVAGTKRLAQGKTVYYRCPRAGRPQQKSRYRKIGKETTPYCTAFIHATFLDNGSHNVKVTYCLGHVGHDRAGVPKKNDEELVVSLLRDGCSFDTIKRKVRDLCKDRDITSRRWFYLLRNPQIRSIAERFDIHPERLDEDDFASLDKRIGKKNPADGIQLYVTSKSVDRDGFLLIIITPLQAQWLREQVIRGICLDYTFEVSPYNLCLATLVIADRYDRGLPAAFLLSYRMTENEVKMMFKEVRKVVPCFNPRFYMSGDDSDRDYFNVFKTVFPDSTTETLLCSRPVLQSMKGVVSSKLRNKPLFEEAMQHLKRTFKAKSMTKFLEEYGLTLKFFASNKEVEMVEYLRNKWDSRVAQWAPLSEHRSMMNTWHFCERWHQELKEDVLRSKSNIRVDSLVNNLIDIVDCIWENFIAVSRCKVMESSCRLQQHHSIHIKACEANRQGYVRKIEKKGESWVVTTKSGEYTVAFVGCDCVEQDHHCRKDDCGACAYAYTCDCLEKKADVSCQHVHLACMSHSQEGLVLLAEDPDHEGLRAVPHNEFPVGYLCDVLRENTTAGLRNESEVQDETKVLVKQCLTEFKATIQKMSSQSNSRATAIDAIDGSHAESSTQPMPRKCYIPISRLPSLRCDVATRRVVRLVPRDNADLVFHRAAMNVQWLIVSTRYHEYSVISSNEVSRGNIKCGSPIKTTDGREVTIIFIGASREQCEKYYKKLSGYAEVKSEDLENQPSTSMNGLSEQCHQPERSENMAFCPVDVVKSEVPSTSQSNGSALKGTSGRTMRVPRSMVLELASTLSGLEDEIRSRFDHLEDVMEETCARITVIENAIKLERTAASISSRNYASSNISDAPSYDSSRPESSMENDVSNSDSAGKDDEVSIFDLMGDEKLVSIPRAVDEVTVLKNQIMSKFYRASQSGENSWSSNGSEELPKRPALPLSISERVEIVLLSEGRNCKEVADEFNLQHPNRRPITRSCVSRLLVKLKETGSVRDRPRSGRPRRLATDDKAALIIECIRRSPDKSIRRIAKETGLSRGSVHRILKEHKDKFSSGKL